MSEAEPTPNDEPRIEDETVCLQCGYALRGLPLSGACPECGLSVKETRTRMHGLSSRQFFTLLVRVFAVVVFISPFTGDFGIIQNLTWMILEDNSYGFATPWSEWLYSVVIPLALTTLLAGAIWFAAPLVACIAAPVSYPLLANLGGQKTARNIALCVFAVWLIATGGESLLTAALYYGIEQDRQDFELLKDILPQLLASGLFRVIAGIVLLGWLNRNRERLA